MMNTPLLANMSLFSGGVWQIIGETGLFGTIILMILVVFSLVSWAIMFNRWRLFKKVDQQSILFLNSFRRARKISEITGQTAAFRLTPFSGMCTTAINEIKELLATRSQGNPAPDSPVKLSEKEIDILGMALDRATTEQIARLERYVVFLATTANAAPFLGLLGTVVGIMDAFWSIGERGSASLAVVAPGIAEALLVTIVGLGAAIPAVIGFNWATNRLKRFNDEATNFSLEFLARVKKDMT